MSNVAQFSVPPKRRVVTHRAHKITITYDPKRNTWDYAFEWTPDPIRYSGTALTEEKAIAKAKKEVDRCLGP